MKKWLISKTYKVYENKILQSPSLKNPFHSTKLTIQYHRNIKERKKKEKKRNI